MGLEEELHNMLYQILTGYQESAILGKNARDTRFRSHLPRITAI